MPTASDPPRLIHREGGPPIRVLPGDVLLRADAARYLGRDRMTLIRWARAGRGPPHWRVAHLVLYPRAGLDEHLRACEATGPPGSSRPPAGANQRTTSIPSGEVGERTLDTPAATGRQGGRR
jgi:hypothetical protein